MFSYKHILFALIDWNLKLGFLTMYLNGITQALILSQDPPDWQEILTYFRGSELQNYFTKILEDDLKAIIKPQYVDQIPKAAKVRHFMS